jgi:hypothetical protein
MEVIMTKIKLVMNVPVSTEHGMTKGRVLEVLERESESEPNLRNRGAWVMGDMGKEVLIQAHEFEVVTGSET